MAEPLSPIVHGLPLAEELGLGALTLTGWLREVCDAGGEREALVFHEGGLKSNRRVSWSYAELWRQANLVARALVACGVGKGSRVGVQMTNRPEFLAGFFGTALAGGVAVPLSTFSTPAEMAYLLQASCVKVLLFERQVVKKDFAEILRGLEPALGDGQPGAVASGAFPFLAHVASIGGGGGAIEDWADFLARGDAVSPAQIEARAATITPADVGAIFFSSGSTAKPKGIVMAHRAIALQLWRWPKWYQAKRGEIRSWSANGFFFSGNFAMTLGGALSSGGSVVLQSAFNAEEALALIEAERATMILAWPHQWGQLVAAPNWASADLSSLVYMDAKSPIAAHPTVNVTWREPFAAYGNTETFTLSSAYPANTSDAEIDGSHGPPCPGNAFKVVDPLTGETLPRGERGEICVKGPTLMLGYLGVPLDETLDDDGFLRTGDGGWFDALGRLHWQGRLNDIIKTGGANVSPVEIDTVLKTIAGVKAVQTVGVPDDLLGELVVACIVPHDGVAISEDSVRAGAREQLAAYKVPRRVLFFAEDELALTGSAKIKAADLRALAAKRLLEEAK